MVDERIARALRHASKELPLGERIHAVWREIDTHNDRAAAIIAGATVERVLSEVLESRFVELSDKMYNEIFYRGGALSNFSSKIQIGFGLGVFGEVIFHDLDLIRQVRNAFAHAVSPIEFTTPSIADACMSLRIIDYQRSLFDFMKINPDNTGEPRGRYTTPVRFIIDELLRVPSPPKRMQVGGP